MCRIEDGTGIISHSTFYNSWFFTPRSTSVISYKGVDGNSLSINNSIVYGTRTDEIELESLINVSLDHLLLKLGNSAQTDYASVFSNCLFNVDPEFFALEEFDFRLKAESPAINKGSIDFIFTNSFDLAGNRRDEDVAPDMGCFEFSEIE